MNTASAAWAISTSSLAWRSNVTMTGTSPTVFLTLRTISASGRGTLVTAMAPCSASSTPSSPSPLTCSSSLLTMRPVMTSNASVVIQLPYPVSLGQPVRSILTSSTSSWPSAASLMPVM